MTARKYAYFRLCA